MIKGAYTIFNNINSDEYTDQEKLLSIKDILSLATHNSITKDSIIFAFRWMYDYCLEEASKPRTNGDKIRAMTDEELTKIIQCPYDTAGKQEDIMPCILDEEEPDFVPYEECQICMLNWLRKEGQEAKEIDIRCKCSTGYGMCIADMDAQQTLGGTIVCDMAEECNFDKSLILKRCEHAVMKEGGSR